MRFAWLAALLLTLSCGGASKEAGSGGTGGAPAELELVPLMHRPFENVLVPLADGDSVDLFSAPQGGHVIVLSARVKGLESSTAKVTSRLVDPQSGGVLVESSRTTNMQPSSNAAWSEPSAQDLYSMVHLAVCPSDDGSAIVGRTLRAELDVLELYADESSASVSLELVPECNAASTYDPAYCADECAAH